MATAPLASTGHVNCSPKGLDTFRVLDSTTVAYLDYVGSGAETIAHLRENGRVVLLFCAFDGPPRILRLHGIGKTIEPQNAEYSLFRPQFGTAPYVRAIIKIALTRISDSCGFGVPRFQYLEDRPQLAALAVRKGAAGLAEYQREKNSSSIDGLPALNWATASGDPAT